MNPYPERIDDLHNWLRNRYGVTDTQAVDVLLASRLPREITLASPPWIMLETDYPSREFSSAWFAFGGAVDPRAMAQVRVERSRVSDLMLREWLATRANNSPLLVVESEWRKLPGELRGRGTRIERSYRSLQAYVIRLRTAYPKSDFALRMNRDADRIELERLARRVLDCSHRSPPAASMLAAWERSVPASLLYWCELLQKVNPFLCDWESLTGSLAAVARGVALLYGGERDPDWLAVDRLLRDNIHDMTAWIMREADSKIAVGRKAYDLFRASGRASDEPLVAEVRRLNREGVLLARQGRERMPHKDSYGLVGKFHPWRYRLASGEWREMLDRDKEILR